MKNKGLENLAKLLIFAIVIFFISTIMISNPVSNLDELWNYDIAKNIAGGKIIYKDISAITTPFSYFIEAIFLKIFGSKLLVFRIENIVLQFGIFILTYLLMKKLTKKTLISLVSASFLEFMLTDYLITIDYNFMSLFLVLLILNLEYSKVKNKDFIIGILGRIMFFD